MWGLYICTRNKAMELEWRLLDTFINKRQAELAQTRERIRRSGVCEVKIKKI